MKIVVNGVGVVLGITGLVFALQGANILPGSVMTGDPFWLVVGIVLLIASGGILYFANRKKGAPRSDNG